MIDAAFQIDLGIRLILAAAFGAAVGLEREIHGHPAGMRTHLLVALGSGMFTVLSIYGFGPATSGTPIDPTRIAAQIVSGIGFLGAGAIIKDGFSIRGLTTAASLWATAAIGLAAGAGEHILAATGTVIVLISLWPLNLVAERIHGSEEQQARVRVSLDRLDAIADVTRILTANRLEIQGVQTERQASGAYLVDVNVRLRPNSNLAAAVESLSRVDGVVVSEAGAAV